MGRVFGLFSHISPDLLRAENFTCAKDCALLDHRNALKPKPSKHISTSTYEIIVTV